ncbi:ninein-like protein isoform X2 [Channa argus]|uniref:ninein-like protein isoform X2 n=1 Tax=Channa argus TaxID=215402 RepID=UPI0035214509
MEEVEHSHYVAQLKAEFDSCDTTATGFLDREELTVLCHKLQLDAHLPLLLDTLLGEHTYARVNFEEFKEGLVGVLSRSLEFSTSEDDCSYLEPVVLEEVRPKFVKGTKRYGRRSCPDRKPDIALNCDSEDSPPSRPETADPSPPAVRRAKLRRSTSLESVESLKSDEGPGSQKENTQPDLQTKGPQHEEVELGVVGGGVLMAVHDHLGLQQLITGELDSPLRKPDTDLEGRVSIRDFQKILRGSAPVSCSTPVQPANLQRARNRAQAVLEEGSVRSTLPSLLTATVGQKVLSRLDDGSGCTSPERVIALWTEEGIRNSRDILQTLDFSLEERLSLADLTLALDNELLVSGNGIHQAALISYKNEIQHLQVIAEQACRERDKVRADLELADQRNLQLIREVDDRHTSMETLNQSRMRDLEQDFRDRLAILRSQMEQESESLLQQVETERSMLQDELQQFRAQEAELQEELGSAKQENSHVEEELSTVKLKLTETESSVSKLQRDLDQLLHDKFGSLDSAGTGLSHEERFTEVIKDYELQCRELQDRNDELSSELELLKSQKSDRQARPALEGIALSWTQESDSDESDMKRSLSPLIRRKLQPADKIALCSLDSVSGPAVSIQTELALEQLKQKHNQELQQLHIQLDTQVNYYERSLELMRQSMEVERKDISQAFKMEISELEEQKTQVEQQVKQLKETVDKLLSQIQHGGGTGWSNEQERRVQRERAELEQNFAREISNLVHRLSAEKDQLEAELKLKLDQEVMLVREESEQSIAQMKLQHAEAQRHLLHQLHLERQRLLEQSALWENRLIQVEQEKLQSEERSGEEQASINSQFSIEKKRMEEKHKEQVCQLKEQVSSLQEVIQSSSLEIRLSEASLEELRKRCGQLEDDLTASHGRCSKLEARLKDTCSQLEESITFLKPQEDLSKRLDSEKSSVDKEQQLVREQEKQLLVQVTQLKKELGNLKAVSDSIRQDREVVVDNCSRLSHAFVQLQVQLRARDMTVSSMRSELESLQETTRTKADCVSKLSAELGLLKMDRARLIQDLKDQAMAVDNLQLELDRVSEELDRSRCTEEGLLEALEQEQTRTSELQCGLDEKEAQVGHLIQENGSYARLADQLSTQIVEMEEEITSLRDHLRDLSSQLNNTADLVLGLRRQLNLKTSEVDRLRAKVEYLTDLVQKARSSSEKHHSEVQLLTAQLQAKNVDLDQGRMQVHQLQQALQDSQNQLRTAEEEFDEEKKKMTQQLIELEKLVLTLEEIMDPGSQHRTQLEEIRSENGALQERLKVLQQEVQNLEKDVTKKRRKLEEMEREHQRSRDAEEKLHKENSKYREEVLDLSSRNLQLSNDNAELSACLRGNQESVQVLQERLLAVSKEQEMGKAKVHQLQEAVIQHEKEKLQQQVQRQLLERDLNSYKDKIGGLELELNSVIQKQQKLEEDKTKLLREADNQNSKVGQLQQSVLSLESEVELLHTQLSAVSQEKLSHTQEVTELQRQLQDSLNKVEEFEANVRKLIREKEELHQALEEQKEQASFTLQEETKKLRLQNQEFEHKQSELQVQGLKVQKLTQEHENLKTKLSELETARIQALDKAVRADTALSLVQAQHVRQLQEMQERVGDGHREQVELLQAQLTEEQRKGQQLDETLKLQDQYEKAMAALQERADNLETKLKGVRMVLQEKVEQLKEQMAKNSKSSALVKDLYIENSQLMKALQVTEQRQKNAEKKNFLLEEKIHALNKLLRDIVPVALAT